MGFGSLLLRNEERVHRKAHRGFHLAAWYRLCLDAAVDSLEGCLLCGVAGLLGQLVILLLDPLLICQAVLQRSNQEKRKI